MIYTKAGNYKCHCSLREFEKQLPAAKFSKSHNSFIVNLGEVASTTRTSLTLANGVELPISQRQYISFDNALIQYIRRY
jgi:DNA-binding LytR/AlgR family response regulator